MSRILVVDNDPQFRRTLSLALGSHDYDVIEAADGREALNLAETRGPDVVVLDWHLPSMNGVEICRLLRGRSDVPIIMISANRTNSRQIAVDAGATDYLPKPFSVPALITRIESAIR